MKIIILCIFIFFSPSVFAYGSYCGEGNGCKWSAGIILSILVIGGILTVARKISVHGFIKGIFVESAFPILLFYIVGFPILIYLFYWVSQFGIIYMISLWGICIAIYWLYTKYKT